MSFFGRPELGKHRVECKTCLTARQLVEEMLSTMGNGALRNAVDEIVSEAARKLNEA